MIEPNILSIQYVQALVNKTMLITEPHIVCHNATFYNLTLTFDLWVMTLTYNLVLYK